MRTKAGLCGGAWVVAIIAIAIVEGGNFSWAGVLLPPVFSVAGFPVFLILAYSTPDSSVSTVVGAFVGWLYYAILTIRSLRARRRVVFIRVFVVLCVSLLVNVAGCEAMSHANIKTERYTAPQSLQATRDGALRSAIAVHGFWSGLAQLNH